MVLLEDAKLQTTPESEESSDATKPIEDAGELPLADELCSVDIEAALALSLDSDDCYF